MPPTRTRSTVTKTVKTLQKRNKNKDGTIAVPIRDIPKDLALCEMVYPLDASTRATFKTRDGKKLTAHQWAVYDFTRKIPRGRVTTYGALCKALGEGSARSVGNALRHNPFAPFVPCHRVITANLYIGGFFGEWGTLGAGASKEDASDSEKRVGDAEKNDRGRQCQRKVEMLALEGVGFTLEGYLADKCLVWQGPG